MALCDNNENNSSSSHSDANNMSDKEHQQGALIDEVEQAAESTDHRRLESHGHLRLGVHPVSVDELKKKRMTKSMVIGLVSLMIALALAVAVFLIVQPEGTFRDDHNAVNSVGANEDATEQDANANDQTNSGEHNASTSTAQTPAAKNNKVNVNQLPDSTFLYDVDISELIKADTFNDGQTVQVKGEVVGDAINDESNESLTWIALQDDDELNPQTISVLVSKQQAEVIDSYGHYGQQGSILQIRGTYHLACADHQGLSDIHAEEAQLVSEGRNIDILLNPVILTAAVISVFLGGVLFVMYSIRRERMR